jgi:dephospho-CoA kinase
VKVALTGGIGSGKSTVAAQLAQRGAIVVDADAIAREVVEPGQPALAEIVAEFGPEVLQTDGRLDRARLAELVFADETRLARLNAIMHPRIAARSVELLTDADPDAIAIYDMPLLVEQGTAALAGWDAIIVVDAPDDMRLERVQGRGLDAEDARRRMEAQAPREARLAIATHVVDNSGDLRALRAQVEDLWSELTGQRA